MPLNSGEWEFICELKVTLAWHQQWFSKTIESQDCWVVLGLLDTLFWWTRCSGESTLLVDTLLWWTHCYGGHIFRVDILLWWTLCYGGHTLLVNTLPWCTHSSCVNTVFFGNTLLVFPTHRVYTLFWCLHCSGEYTVMVHTQILCQHCLAIGWFHMEAPRKT